jgi:methyltransferase family protein
MSREFPELAAQHLFNAKLYATRCDLIADLAIPRGGTVAELGVALGTFSRFLVDNLQPRSFHGFDLFQLHHQKTLWGQDTHTLFQGMTHLEFYRAAMQSAGAEIVIHDGPSQSTLPLVPDHLFDMIYVDAEHTYDEVKADASLAARKLKSNGILVFNDYIMHDRFAKADYGVVPVVNEMVVQQGWKVIGFALQKHLFCDIAIAR